MIVLTAGRGWLKFNDMSQAVGKWGYRKETTIINAIDESNQRRECLER